jgi:hypothetical protein
MDVNANPEAKEWPGFKPRTTIGLEIDHQSPKN